MSRPRLYLCAPYSSSPAENTRRSITAAYHLMGLGFAVFNPLLSHFSNEQHERPYEDWLELDLAWLEAAHVVFRLSGSSPGADRETAHAATLGIPVFTTGPALLEWWQPFQDLPEGLREAWLRGRARWNGKRLEPIEPAITALSGVSLSEMVIEDRGR
jgi:hypothetical protein